MRLLLLVALVLALCGFDHIFHARDLDVKGIAALPCTRCHAESKGKLVGKPGHAACFGACHGAAPAKPKRGAKLALGDRGKVCSGCHADAQLQKPFAGKLPARYPPYAEDPDFNISFGHKQHGTLGCTQCHDLRPGPKPVHQRCLGCHDGSGAQGHGPPMTACAGCHPRAIGKPQPPELAVVRDSVSATFSHAKHNARGAAGRDCLTCHAAIRTSDDSELPRPQAKDCATSGCHDRKAAFPITAACTRCHDRAPEQRFEVHRPVARFVHAGAHADVVKQRPCSACHPLSARGEVMIADHEACTECHAADFAARKPFTCGACHNATEPWRKLVADRALPDRTEFGAELDHDKHKTTACTTCHQLRTVATQLRTPRGHASCIGKGCHEVKSGPAPRLETCDGCHRMGLAAERERARVNAQWSVRRAFDHTTHQRTPDQKPIDCTSCHAQLAGMLLAMPTPQKAACVLCHDQGKPAFKLTGTTCGRCHVGGTP
jgi:c(7)-type cytochrome triheme protein